MCELGCLQVCWKLQSGQPSAAGNTTDKEEVFECPLFVAFSAINALMQMFHGLVLIDFNCLRRLFNKLFEYDQRTGTGSRDRRPHSHPGSHQHGCLQELPCVCSLGVLQNWVVVSPHFEPRVPSPESLNTQRLL
jgi:hypothetical protein